MKSTLKFLFKSLIMLSAVFCLAMLFPGMTKAAEKGYTIVTTKGTSSATNAGSYTVYVIPDSNHEWDTGSDVTGERAVSWRINPATVTPPTVNTGLVYNGNTQVGVPTGTNYSVSNGSKSGAGNYTATVTLNNKTNYIWKDTNTNTDKSMAWSIAPAIVTPPTPKPDLVYNGTEQTGVVSTDTSKYTVGGIYKATSAGEHIATAALTSTTNYKWSDNTTANKSISWSIARASIAKPTSTDYVYDGTEKTGVPAGTGYIRDGKYVSTLAGNYTATAEPDSNHKWTDGTLTKINLAWTIERASISVPTGTDYDYDGTEKIGVPAGDGYTRDGRYVATLTGDYVCTVIPDSNHKWTDGTTVSKDIEWHITKISIVVTTTKRSLVYTGSPLAAPNGVTVTKPDDYRIEFGKEENAYTGMPSWTEAGIYTVYFKVTADNYEDVKGSYEFEIEEKGIHVPKAVSLTYNGEEQTGVPEGTGYTITGNTGTDAGSYTAVATPIKNYKWYSGTGSKNISWSIARKGISEPTGISGLVYDGTLKTGVTNGTGYTVTDNTGTDAGSYTAKATPGSNYQWDSGSNTTATRDIPWSIERADGSVTINADEIVLTYPADGTFTFSVVGDGTVSVTVADASIASASLTDNTVTTHPVNVGESTATVTKSAGKNYKAASASIPVRVDPGTIQASSTKQTGYYNGSAITPAGITVIEPSNATVLYSATTVRTRAVPTYTLSTPPSLTNAGSYNILYQVTAPNYQTLSGTYDVDINKANISVEVPHTKVTYDGSSKQADGIRVLDPASGAVVKYGTQAGSYDLNEAPSFTDAGEHMVYYKVTAENYNDLTGSYKFEILPANMIVRVKNDTKVYTGNEIVPAPVELLYPDSGVIKYGTTEGSYTLDAPKAYTNVGTYTIYYKVTADNFNDKEGSYTLEITAKPISVPSAVSGLIYNGEVQTGVISGDGYTVTGNTGKDASSYTATVTPDSNHKWSDGSTDGKAISWSIARKPVPVPVAVNGLVFNGENQTGVASGEGYSITGDASAIAAGTYTAKVTPYSNYEWSTGTDKTGERTVTWSIAPKPVVAPVAHNYTYDSENHIGVASGTGYTLTGTASENKAGDYSVTASLENSYIWSDGTTNDKSYLWSIARKPVTRPAVHNYTYDYKEHIGVFAGEGYTLAGTITEREAGDHTVNVTLDPNYRWSTGTEVENLDLVWHINKKAVSVPVGHNFTFDGEEHTGVNDGEGYTLSGNKAVNAGVYTATATLLSNFSWMNGSTEDKNISWNIARKSVAVPGKSDYVYDGMEKTGVKNGTEYTLSGDTKGTNAGSYTVTAKVDDNHVWEDGKTEDKTLVWKIAPKSVNVPKANTGLIYDGTEKTGVNAGTEYTVTGNKAVNAGNYTATVSIDNNHIWDDGTSQDKEISWSVASGAITLSVNNMEYVYDGTAHTPDTVTVIYPGTGYTVKYGKEYGTYDLDAPLTYTSAGVHNIYYQITADNFTTVKGYYTLTITRKAVDAPVAVTGLTYNGAPQTGVPSGAGFSLTDNIKIDAGSYTAVAKLDDNHKWSDNTIEDKSINWSIAQDVPVLTAPDHYITYPDEVTISYLSNSDGTVTAVSSDETIVTVDNGVIVPVKAGKAEITLNQAATNNFTAATKTFNVTVSRGRSRIEPVDDMEITYPEKVSVPVTRVGNGALTVTSSNENVATVSMNGLDLMIKSRAPGKAIITLEQAESGQSEYASAMFVLTVKSGAFEAEPKKFRNLVYNGQPMEIGRVDVTAPTDPNGNEVPYDIFYKSDIEDDWSETMPAFVNAGVHTVWYKIFADNYEDLTGSFEGTIKKADSALTLASDITIPYDGYDHAFTYGSVGGGDITVKTLSGNQLAKVTPSVIEGNEDVNGGMVEVKDIKGTGTMILKVSMSDTQNWNGTEKTVNISITEKTYTISIDTGESVIVKTYAFGGTITLPEITKAGNTFKGWYDGDRLITSEMTDEIDVPAKDTVISAKWEPNSYIVEFDPNGGRGSIKSQERVYGDRVELPSHEGFKYKAHAFSHWNTKADDTGDKFLDCSIRDISESEDVTLYAIWTESAVPDESEINEDKPLYQVGDRYYIDGSLYICKKDTTDNTSPDEDPEHWVKTGDEETDNTVPFNSDTLTVSGNRMVFDRGDYIYVENSDKKTSDIYVCLTDGTDGSEWLNDNWKKVAQTEAQLIYNTNIIYKQGDTIYKDGSILICNKDGVTGAFRSEHWIQQLILAKAVKAESEESRIGLRHGTKVRAKVLPEDATDKTVVWESLTPDVATVDDEGNVTAISDGIAEIMATASSGVTDSVEIEIYIDLDGMDFTETEDTIREGQEKTMVPVFIPADAEHGDIRWTSTEPGNVSVNENGVIKGLKRGTSSVIEAYCSGKTARCTITVTDPCEVSVVPENLKLYLNGVNEYDLSCVIEPSDAGDIEWKSVDPDVVSVDENGHIRALSLGETDIQATCLGVTDTCHVTVEEGQIEGITLDKDYIELTVKDSVVLNAKIIPANAKPGKITWESDEEITLYLGEDKMSVIAVPEKMGVYTVTVREESGVSASCQIRGIEYYDFAKEGNLVTSSSEHEVRKIKGSFYCFDSLGRAEAGFITVNGSTYYFDPDTGIAVKGLQEIKGALYFFDKKTCVMVQDNKVKANGKTYHFGSDGKAVGGVYYLPDKKDSKAWFYFDEDAVMQNGVFPATLAEDGIQRYYHFKNGKLNNPKKDGFQKVNGYRYYVYTDGHVATGIVDIADKKGTKTYCFYEDGRLAVGAVLSGNRLIPVDKDGQIATPKKPGLTKIGCDYYWYNEDGSVLTGWKDVTDKNGAVKATYYFDPDTGASSSGIREIDGVKYIFRNGACIRKDSVVTVNKKKYVVKVDGTGHKGCAVMQFGLTTLSNGKTYYTDKRTGVIRTGLLTVSDNTLSNNICYTSKSGEFQKNKWVKINKKKYHTDSNGVLQTGRTDINGKIYYFDPDSKPAGAMKTGLVVENDLTYLYGDALKTSDIFDNTYLYGTNGVLQTGGKFVSYKGKKYFVDNEGRVLGLNDGYITVPDSKKGEVTYELGEDGALLNGTKEVDGKLYLYKNGIQVLSKPAPKKNIGGVWKTVNKKKYLLGYTDSVSANVCYTGYYTDPKGKEYLFMEDGHMASAELVEVPFGEITDKMTPDADGSYWYYYNKKGQRVTPEMTKGGWFRVSGTRAAYIYDSGCAASGWMNIDGKEYYFDPESGITTVKLSFIERLLFSL